jgi:transposase
MVHILNHHGDLVPKLPPNSVVVWDNASFHKRHDIERALAEAGHTLEYTPTYSPDLNAIEPTWAAPKKRRRKTRLSIPDLFKFESFYVR